MVFTFARSSYICNTSGCRYSCQYVSRGFSKVIVVLFAHIMKLVAKHRLHILRKRVAIANYSHRHNTMLYSLSPCPIATNQIVCFIENTKRNGICWEVAIGKYHSIEGCIFSYVSNHFHDFIEYRKSLFKRHLECATILPIATSVGCSSFYDNALAAYRAWFAYKLIRRLQA